MRPKIVVMGGINQDFIITTPRIPRLGETVIGGGFSTAAGGKAANQAVAAARLGGDITLIGAVGDDSAGQHMLTDFAHENINITHIRSVPGVPTGTAVITLYQGDNYIVTDPGANPAVITKQIDEAEDLIKSASMLIMQLEIPMESLQRAARLAKKHNVSILLNPAPPVSLDASFLALADIVTPNETESEFITGIHIKTLDDAFKSVSYLLDKGVKQAIVTLGAQGAVYNDGTELRHCPAYPVNPVVDTTGAGDCFTAAVAIALTEGKTISEAILFGCAASALTVMRKGAQPSLPTRAETEEFINNNGRQYK